MTKQATKQAPPTPVVPIPAGTVTFPWSIKGKGKSATYCAGLPSGSGEPGQRVALVAKSGAVTFISLTEIRETGDGVSRWDFIRDADRMTPEVRRSNRVAKSDATSAYWSSDAGLKTAERIAAKQAETESDQATEEVAEEVTKEVAKVDTTEMAKALKAAGFTAMEVVAALKEEATKAPTTKAPATKAPKVTTEASDVLTTCDSCNRDRKGVVTHSGAPELETCPRCSSLDADTARTRAKRHSK